MGDVLDVSTAALNEAGTQVAATSESASHGSAALAGIRSAISGPALGGSIGVAAAQFATTLADTCSKLTGAANSHGGVIAQSAQVYFATDNGAAKGFQRVGGVISGHPAI